MDLLNLERNAEEKNKLKELHDDLKKTETEFAKFLKERNIKQVIDKFHAKKLLVKAVLDDFYDSQAVVSG